ncbi:MAG: amino acid racemase [Patescibacteria group bacterium]
MIGILAGMGPKSTSPFLDLVIEQCQKQYGARNDIDFPHIIIYSLPTPFYVNQTIDDKEMESTIRKGLQKLESTGVDFISIPCNSAHKYFDNLQNCIKTPLLNIIDSTIKKLNKTSQRVALFAARTTIDANIYQKGIKKQNIEIVLKEEWQKEVNNLIQSVKNGEKNDKLSTITKKLSKYLKEEEIDTIIIACTDITKIVKTMKGFTIIDSSEALAEETIKKYLDYRV